MVDNWNIMQTVSIYIYIFNLDVCNEIHFFLKLRMIFFFNKIDSNFSYQILSRLFILKKTDIINK